MQLMNRVFPWVREFILCSAGVAWAACLPPAGAQEGSPRVTRTVELIREIEPGVAAVFAIQENGDLSSGSGSVIHAAGYVLTNDHVARLATQHNVLGRITRNSFEERDYTFAVQSSNGEENPSLAVRRHRFV